MSKDNARVYVGGLVEGIKKEDLEREFDKYGKLNSVWVALNPPGFAFIEFENNKDAEDACEGMNGYELMGAKLKVEMSRPRDRNRGGRGGGGGGFRSSFGGRGDGFRSQGGSGGGGGGGFQRSSFGGRQNYGDRNGGGGYGGGGRQGGGGGGFQNNYRSRSPLDRY